MDYNLTTHFYLKQGKKNVKDQSPKVIDKKISEDMAKLKEKLAV